MSDAVDWLELITNRLQQVRQVIDDHPGWETVSGAGQIYESLVIIQLRYAKRTVRLEMVLDKPTVTITLFTSDTALLSVMRKNTVFSKLVKAGWKANWIPDYDGNFLSNLALSQTKPNAKEALTAVLAEYERVVKVLDQL